MPNKPLPVTVLYRNKTARSDRHGKPDERVHMPAKMPACPRWLDKEAKAEWRRVTRLMKDQGILAEVDRTTLTQYCQLWSDFVAEPQKFTAAQHTQLRLCCVELGFTPSARARLRKPPSKDGNSFGDL